EKKKKGSNTWTEWLIPASPFELCQTILAMAQKRAFVAAQRNMGAASQFFNIDEDIVQDQGWNSRGGASSSGGGRKSGGGSRSTKAKPMSGRQAEFVQDLAKKASLAGADLNAYCETKFKKPYFEYLGSEDGPDKDAIEAKRKEGFLVTDDGWLYPLMSEEASVLLDDLKEGKVEKAQVEEAQTE
ncbi:MAG: hypothetical protein MJA83_18810, partial [Gammaproteobacteria bacterium]|nr:hypothetical protein [Gammaproteobacteria bacterium]